MAAAPVRYGALVSSSGDSEADFFSTEEGEMTIQEAVEIAGFGKYQIKLLALLAFVAMAESMEIMLLGILSPELHCEWGLDETEQAMLTTLVFIGMTVGAPFWGLLCDKYGRRPGLIASIVVTVIFALLSAVAPSYLWLLFFRTMAGFGMGAAPLCAAAFCEYTPIAQRGKSLLALLFFWSIGSVFEVLLGLVVMQSLGWRWFVGISALPVLIFTIMAPFWLPESSRFLLVSGKQDKAREALETIARANGTTIPPLRLKDEAVDERGKLRDLFTGEHRTTTIINFFLWFTIIFAYYGIVLFATVLYASDDECKGGSAHREGLNGTECIGLHQEDYIALTWTSLAEIPGAILSFFLVDSIGRKKTMAFQQGVQTIATVVLFFCLSHTGVTVVISIARAMALGAFDVIYIYTPEVYPTKMRGIGTGICSSVGHIGAMLTPVVAQVMSSWSLEIPIAIYAACSLVATFCAMLLPYETSGIDTG